MSEDIFIEINNMKEILNQNIIYSNASKDNIIKAKKIHNELGIMLCIWTDDENIKTLTKDDKKNILNTTKLIIKKAKELL